MKSLIAFLLLATVASAGGPGTPGVIVTPGGRMYSVSPPDKYGDMTIMSMDGRGGFGYITPPKPRSNTILMPDRFGGMRRVKDWR